MSEKGRPPKMTGDSRPLYRVMDFIARHTTHLAGPIQLFAALKIAGGVFIKTTLREPGDDSWM
jgi:hypothetical protein